MRSFWYVTVSMVTLTPRAWLWYKRNKTSWTCCWGLYEYGENQRLFRLINEAKSGVCYHRNCSCTSLGKHTALCRSLTNTALLPWCAFTSFRMKCLKLAFQKLTRHFLCHSHWYFSSADKSQIWKPDIKHQGICLRCWDLISHTVGSRMCNINMFVCSGFC